MKVRATREQKEILDMASRILLDISKRSVTYEEIGLQVETMYHGNKLKQLVKEIEVV